MAKREISVRRTRLALCLGTVLAGAVGSAAWAQAADDGAWRWSQGKDGVAVLTTSGIDEKAAEAADLKRYESGELPHFAVALKGSLTPQDAGTWDQGVGDTRRWRLQIQSPGAKSINLGFTRYHLPEGAQLRILDAERKPAFRAFTAADNEAHGQLWTPIVKGSAIELVLTVPARLVGEVQLELGSINHGYRGFGETPSFLKSGSCNVDTVCPDGDGWRDQIQSSAAISTGGTIFCSGSLINNARNDRTPYFLTANHCGITAGEAPSLVTYWNFANSTCRTPGTPGAGGPGDGPLTQFNTGSTLRAAYAPSDMTLVELDDPVDAAAEPFFSGWDATSADATSAVAIHHPDGEEKRISFENAPTTTTSYLGTAVPGDGTHVRVEDWDLGTTEPGSSGSPLYNQDQRIIGQLHGGFAACGNDDSDWYGRVSVSWDGGGTDATRLSTWLDPDDSGVMAIDGTGLSPFNFTLTPPAAEICTASTTSTQVVIDVTADDGFAGDVTLSDSGVPIGASSSFSTNPVTPPGSSNYELTGLDGAAPGDYTITISGTDATDTVDRALALSLFDAAPGAATLGSPADGAGGIGTSTTVSWDAVAQAQDYLVEVDDDPAFGSPEFSATVSGTEADVSGLAANTTYYWRVTADNACGAGAASATFSFTTGSEYCSAPGVAIPDNTPAGVSDQIVVPSGANLADLDVAFTATHTWTGDLIVTLAKEGSGIAIELINRPGVPDIGAAGCNGNDPDVVLDDEATDPVDDSCTEDGTAYPPGSSWQPTQPLSAFDGESFAGTWTLTVSDNAGLDTGTLERWCLQPTGAATETDAVDDSYSTQEDVQLDVPAPGVLGNDAAPGTLTAAIDTGPANGTLVGGLAADGSFSYLPNAGFCGIDSFTYTADDGTTTDVATVTIDVVCDLVFYDGFEEPVVE